MKTVTMKKIIVIFAALILLTAIASGIAGYISGKHHAIMAQEIWVMEFYPENAEYDVQIGVELDGNWYTYDGYIG